MEVKKTSRKTLVASGLAVAVSVALLAGTTFAWFTDSVVNKGNKIESGTLDVTLSELDKENGYQPVGEQAIFDYANWEPGYSDVAAFKIGNEGSLALKYQFDIVTTGDGAAELDKLAEVIDVYYRNDNTTGESTTLPENVEGMTKVGTLSEVLANQENGVAFGHLESGEADYATIALKMQETAGNDYQGLAEEAEFDIVLKATQYTSETDGFGSNQYDAAATYPVVTEDEFKDAIENAPAGSTISLASDLVIDETVSVNENITIEGNGAAIDVDAQYGMTIANTGATIKGVHFEKGGVQLTAGTDEVVIDGCTFDYGEKGQKSVFINGSNTGSITIQNCTISQAMNLEGIGNTVSNVTIQSNVFKGANDNTLTLNGKLENVEICNNQFQKARLWGHTNIRVYNNGTYIPDFTNVSIHDNTYTGSALVKFDNSADESKVNMNNNTHVEG